MSKNFQIRLIVSIGLFITVVISMLTFNGIPFKILIALFAIMAAIELLSFLEKKKTPRAVFMLICELLFLICGTIFASNIGLTEIWYLIFGVCGYDVFAYLCGNLFGGKLTKRRPFPRISKNKTWEGTIAGLIISTALVALLMYLTGAFAAGSTAWPFLLCGPLALLGDLFESDLKRQFKIKDSNEIVVKNPFFDKIEYLIGEKDGHGGFLDRADSLAFTTTILYFISIISNYML